jgi:hypothetical protein
LGAPLALGAAAAATPLSLAAAGDDGRRLRQPGSLPFPGRPAGEPQPDLAPELAPIEHIVAQGRDPFGDDYTRLGFRVPAVVVSPWARRDLVSHTVFDHPSVLRTIEVKWNPPSLTLRDANANDLRECLVRRGPAPFLEPPDLATAPASQPTRDPVADSNFCATTPGAAGQLPPPLSVDDRRRQP